MKTGKSWIFKKFTSIRLRAALNRQWSTGCAHWGVDWNNMHNIHKVTYPENVNKNLFSKNGIMPLHVPGKKRVQAD